MSNQENMGKGFLKDKLGDYQVYPPENVWESIASQLGGTGRRRMIIIALSAAATIALAVTLGINYFAPELPDKDVITETTESGTVQIQLPEKEPIQDQSPTTGPGQVQLAISEPERQTLEEKVASAIEEIAEKSSYLGASEPEQVVAVPETLSSDLYETEGLSDLADLSDEGKLVIEKDIAVEEALVEMDDLHPGEEQSAEPSVDLLTDAKELEADFLTDPVSDLLEEKGMERRWIIGAALSPLYSFRDAEASAMSGAAEFESGMVAYAGGVNVIYRTGSRVAIESGLFYNKMGISIGAPGIQFFNQSYDFSPLGKIGSQSNVTAVTNSVGNIVARSGEVYVNNYLLNAANEVTAFNDPATYDAVNADQGIRQHLDYLELPFNLRYTLVDRVIELQLVGGMSTNFLVDNYVTMETSMGTTEIGYLTNIRSVNYSGNAGLGMIYHLHERFSLHLEPRFRYFLNSVNDATLPVTRPYTFGVFTGLSYIF